MRTMPAKQPNLPAYLGPWLQLEVTTDPPGLTVTCMSTEAVLKVYRPREREPLELAVGEAEHLCEAGTTFLGLQQP